MILDINLTDVPDSTPQIPIGVYTFEVTAVEVGMNKSGDGQLMTLSTKVVGPAGDNVGRETKYWISLKPYKNDSTGKQHLIPLVRLLKSCGMDPAGLTNGTGFDTAMLVNKTFRGKVASRVVDKDGQKKEYTGIDEILIPGDSSYAV